MSAFSTLTVERRDNVALVTFRRPAQLNAMNRQMQVEITAAFTELGMDAEARCIVVIGEGRGFMAGADIKEYAMQTGPEFDAFQHAGAAMYAAIEGNPKPVIAAVNGVAAGGGFELVLCCDIVLAVANARMGLPEIKLGLVPGGGGTQRAVAKLGRNQANLLLLTGVMPPASAFAALGLVGEIVAAEDLLPRAMAIAAEIAAEPAEATAGLKRLTSIAATGNLAKGLREERELVCRLYRSEISQQRLQGFAARSATRAAKPAATS